MKVTLLAGGVGGARFTRGLLAELAVEDDAEQQESLLEQIDAQLYEDS